MLVKTIIKLGQLKKNAELCEFIQKIEPCKLKSIAIQNVGKSENLPFWNYLLVGFSCSRKCCNLRFEITMAILRHMNTVELNTKQTTEVVNRLFVDLPKFKTEHLVEMIDFCIESIRTGDPKCLAWKDLLPELLKLCCDAVMKLNVNGVFMLNSEYRTKIIRDLCQMKWNIKILTPLSGMFKEMSITKDETSIVIGKLCEYMPSIEPLELPALAYQLFLLSMSCTSSLIIIPILALQKYFHKNYYRKIFSTTDSDNTDLDSIDPHSDKEFREAEETILFHLSNCTEYKIEEKDVVNMFKPLAHLPASLLTPFMISSLITMSKINRYPESTRLAGSPILLFLCNVIRNFEHENKMSNKSAWCRSRTETSSNVHLDSILSFLIDQSKDGMEVVTSGLVNLSFCLLKLKKQQSLNAMALTFLQDFIKKRFIFGKGIIKRLAEFLFADQECLQYTECLTTLSLTNTLTVSECKATVNNILDYLLMIDGHIAMRMMSIIFPLIKISNSIRDAFIEILRKAIYQRDVRTRQMSVFGFCALLKQLKNNNSRQTVVTGGAFSQATISGLSLISQATIGTTNNLQRHFDTLTLEIIGVLRKCFTQNVEIKETLYICLYRAAEFNSKLLPHILQFMDWHFRIYFKYDETSFEIKFGSVIIKRNSNDTEEIVLHDNLGKLLQFMTLCVVLCDKHELSHDNKNLKSMFIVVINRLCIVTKEDLEITDLDHRANIIGCQYINCLEAMMGYCAWACDFSNKFILEIEKLFQQHKVTIGKFKTLEKKKKRSNDITTTDKLTGRQGDTKSITFNPDNLWEITTIERFLRIIYDDSATFAPIAELNILRSDVDFKNYILKITTEKVAHLKNSPEYFQVKHSKRIFGSLCECSKIIYQKCLFRLLDTSCEFDMSAAVAECFKNILITVEFLYRRKFEEFIKIISPVQQADSPLSAITIKIQEMIEGLIQKDATLGDDANDEKILLNMFQSLEILYGLMSPEKESLPNSYMWLYTFCLQNKNKFKSLGLVHKILFDLRMRTQNGIFFHSIATQIAKKYGQITEEEMVADFVLKSITATTVDSCLIHLCNCLQSQIEEVDYFIQKANSLHFKLKLIGQGNNDSAVQQMKSMERSICSQMIHICGTLVYLCNAQIPLGLCMDTVLKLLIKVYICLTNLTKHFASRHTTINVSYHRSKFDQVVKATKPLAVKIYDLIPYIEENIFKKDMGDKDEDEDYLNENDRMKVSDAKSDKARVIRETKNIPKLIFRIENFNKFVIMLGQKTKNDLSYLLHFGRVRDFRIKTKALLTAIQNSISNSNSQAMECETMECDSDAENEETDSQSKTIPSVDASQIIVEAKDVSNTNLMKNLALVNKKTKKKSVKSNISDNSKSIKKKKQVKNPKINKRILETVNQL